MKVFKFGGASVASAQAVRNMCQITLDQGSIPLVVVVSAMGKSTNALEELIALSQNNQDYQEVLKEFREFHISIAEELFNDRHQEVRERIEGLIHELDGTLGGNQANFDAFYDSVVCFGELLSSTIIQGYLKSTGTDCTLIDARQLILTDSTYREGKVLWLETQKMIREAILNTDPTIFITQGFIAANKKGKTLTLGREGSDFTAAIFAYCLEAESVTIWKDVPGILNADPNRWEQTVKYPELSYAEAAEMTYYGATVIHPKTIRPLAIRKIPLVVKSFVDPVVEGTRIADLHHAALEPAIIFKPNQCLISFQVRDFSFINESKLSMIFHLLEECNIKINMMQSSAISFSVCIDSPDQKMKVLINSLSAEFDILYNDHLELITIKNYKPELVEKLKQGKQILLEQKSRKNHQMLTTTSYSSILA